MRKNTCVRYARTYADNVHRVFSGVCLTATDTFIIIWPHCLIAMFGTDDTTVEIRGTELPLERAEHLLDAAEEIQEYAPAASLRLDAMGDDYVKFDYDHDEYAAIYVDGEEAAWAKIGDLIEELEEAIENAEQMHPALEMLEEMDSVVEYNETYAYVDLDVGVVGDTRIDHDLLDLERAEEADSTAPDDADMYVSFELLDE